MPRKDTHFPLLDYLDELVENLRQHSPKALRGREVEAVHQARVASRRLKAATQMLSPLLSKRCRKPFEKVTRNLRRRLGPLRDLDVMLEHLGEIKDVKFQPAKAWLKYRLSQNRSDAIEKATDRQPPSHALAKLGSWWGIHEEIADVKDEIDDLLAKSVHLQLAAFIERAADTQGDPHALRIAGKSLRYTLEMAKEHGHRLPESIVRPFKQMQSALGLWHDYVVLTERILAETVGCDLALHDPQLQAQILRLSQRILDMAQQHLKKMKDLWQRRGTELCEQIRKSFPLTAPQPLQKIEVPEAGEAREPEADHKEEEKFPEPHAAEIPVIADSSASE